MGSRGGAIKVAAKKIGIPVEEYLRLIDSGMKWCTKCKTWKPAGEFFKDRSRGDGLSSCCATCKYPNDLKKITKALRREKASAGLAYCRRCHDWKNASEVIRGLCKPHWNEYNRERYAKDAVYRSERRQHAHSRKRGVDPVPPVGQEHLMDEFDGKCAYCGAPAITWDHIIPVSKGGETKPYNIVPACVSCNSSKKDQDLLEWATKNGITVSHLVLDRMTLEFI